MAYLTYRTPYPDAASLLTGNDLIVCDVCYNNYDSSLFDENHELYGCNKADEGRINSFNKYLKKYDYYLISTNGNSSIRSGFTVTSLF